MNNIQFISDAYMCSNCGACNAICPKGAISFDYTSMGRLFANALNSLVKTDGIGYLEQQVSDESDYKQQAEILKSFIITERNNTRKQITAIAFNELKKQEKKKKLVYRIAHRVKRLLKR